MLVLLNIGCDQVTKEVVRNTIAPMEYIAFLNDRFILTNVENTGAMLGFGENLSPILKRILLQGLPIIVLLILLFRILKKPNIDRWLTLAFAFVIGGGIGNLIDRVAHGSVTDFFQIKWGFFKTGIFNMADVSVSLGILIIIFMSFRQQKPAL
ncbi:signal peptidase II [uncultured Kriegella sp.]|uniref:signal peptidase II n=1 Tax=uncultured Kriegella sp. TaxID=1798910 RepID=UPI0030D86989|tara:strand:+ start:311309 stop:311767 length:459 start_codon:yes stop_codon:yes gene_type:complete